MGSPTIFAGKFTKLLTQKGILESDGSLLQNDGVKNYIKYGHFENAATTGWNTFITSVTNYLPTGSISSGDSNTIITTTNSAPLSGDRSLQWTFSSNAMSGGYGFISDSFTIENEDLCKVLTVGFSYQVTQGASNVYLDGTIGRQTVLVYLYDVTNSTWLQPAGFLGMNQNSGSGKFSATFQTSSTSGQQYRLAVFACEPTIAFTDLIIKFDNFYVSPQVIPFATPITDYIDYTPTISWSSGYTASGKYRRIGDSLEIIAKISVTGAPISSSDTLISLPNGFTIDTTKMMNTVAGAAPVYGDAIGYDLSTTNLYLLRCQYWSTTQVKLFYQSSSTGQESAVTTSVPPPWSTGDTIIARFSVPVTGFSSSTQMSNDTDTRVVAEIYYGNAASAITANTTNIPFTTKDQSTHGAWSGSVFTAPVAGFYQIFGSVNIATGDTAQISAYVNSVQKFRMFTNIAQNSTIKPFSGMVYLYGGDTLSVRSTGNATLSNTSAYHWISIVRMSGATTIASPETVACEYVSTAGNSLTNATGLFVDFPTKQGDTHGSVLGAGSGNNSTATNTWRFVAPIAGRYIVNASISFAIASSTTVEFITRVYVNNVVVQQGIRQSYTAWVSSDITVPVTAEIKLNAGDYVSIYAYQSSGANRNMSGATGANRVSIIRIGY